MILQHPRWTDQPEFEEFNGLLDLAIDGPYMIQIADVTYKGKKGVIVSCGTLFGSQTILVNDCREALAALNYLQDAQAALSASKKNETWQSYLLDAKKHGWELLPNKEKKNGKA